VIRWFAASTLVALTLALCQPAAAQSTAGGASLQIPPDVRAEGMGRAWTPLATSPYAAWGNVGGLGLLDGVQLATMHSRLVPDLADDVTFDYTAIVAGYSPLSVPVPLNFSIGWNRTHLDYGTVVAFNPDSPDPLGSYNATETVKGFTLALGVGGVAGIGVGIKTLDVDLGLGGTGSTRARDFGLLVRTPYLVLGTDAPGPISVARPRTGDVAFRVLGAVAWSNRGNDISISQTRQGDPLPKTRRESIGFELGVIPLSRYVTARSGFVERFVRDARMLSVAAALGRDKNLVAQAFPDSIAAQLSKNEREGIRTYKGFEVRLLDAFSYRRGSIFDDPGEIKGTTTGWGISLLGYVGFDHAEIPQYKELQRVKKWSFWVRVPLDWW